MKPWEIMTDDERVEWAEKARASGLGKYKVEELIEYQRLRQQKHALCDDVYAAERALEDAKGDLIAAKAAYDIAEKALSDHEAKISKAAEQRTSAGKEAASHG